mgnify:CR=1 FL=1
MKTMRTISWTAVATTTVGFVAMFVGAGVDTGFLVVAGAVGGAVGAVVGLLAALTARTLPGALFGVASVIGGAGFASWFFLDDSEINIAGLAATVIGVVALWVLAVPLSRRRG